MDITGMTITIYCKNSEVLFMKYNSIGQQLIAKAKEIDPSYKPDKFNDMSEALNIILNNLDTYATFNDLHTFDIGNITSSSNIYQTLYQNVYENDTTKKNVVIFSTEDFVDSATSLISSGEHIATPYQDNKILIDSVFVLNSDNSATTIISSDTVIIDLGELSESGTLSSEILTQIKDNLESKSITFTGTIYGFSFTTSTYLSIENVLGLSILTAGRDNEVEINLSDGSYYNYNMELVTTEDLKTINNTPLFGAGNIAVQEPLVSGTNIKTVNGQSLLGQGDLPITADITYATDNEVNALFTSSGQPIPNKTISLENLNAFKQQINNEINNEIGQVLVEGF